MVKPTVGNTASEVQPEAVAENASNPTAPTQHLNPAGMILPVKSGEEDLHGDWITVVKHKKQPKSRSKSVVNQASFDMVNGKEGKLISQRNKFGALSKENPTKPGIVIHSADTGSQSQDGPTFSSKPFLSKKKRVRAEPPLVQPKIFGAEKYGPLVEKFRKTLLSGPGEPSNTKPLTETNALTQVMGREQHPFGIQTAMHVEVVSPNHLRLLDEDDKPPDPQYVVNKIIDDQGCMPLNKGSHECGSGGTFCRNKAARFASMLADCNLLDIGATGNAFTWVRKENGVLRTAKRLDRALADCSWRTAFQEAYLENLCRVYSDHCHLLLCVAKGHQIQQNRPFRYLDAWSYHQDYHQVVLNAWRSGRSNALDGLDRVRRDSVTFNKEVFGNIFQHKRRVESRLRGVQ
ncbi:Endonuclease/exonuclease/phosphatase superfamily [Sesbania bispinosa]|nr:Endonuclease/exonuclease/phosphatase superfamily [Sesbania bispinosa]